MEELFKKAFQQANKFAETMAALEKAAEEGYKITLKPDTAGFVAQHCGQMIESGGGMINELSGTLRCLLAQATGAHPCSRN